MKNSIFGQETFFFKVNTMEFYGLLKSKNRNFSISEVVSGLVKCLKKTKNSRNNMHGMKIV